MFSGGQFVHIIRDGRDVALPTESDRGGQNDPQSRHVLEVTGRTGTRLRGSVGFQTATMRSVTQALIADARAQVRDLCDSWVSTSSAMLEYYKRGETLASSTKDRRLSTALSKPPTSGLRDWRKQMKKSDIALFEAIAGDLLVDLGYERSTSATSMATRLRVGAAHAQWQWRRIGARLGRTTRRFRRPRTT